MENMTKDEALKELAENIWNDDDEWSGLESALTLSNFQDNISPESFRLYKAAVATDNLEKYLRIFYDHAEHCQIVRIYRSCKDCYDYISNDDPGHVADVFDFYYGADEGEMIFNNIEKCVKKIEEDGEFWKEVPELLETFSTSRCDCCKSPLHGERFFLLFHDKFGE